MSDPDRERIVVEETPPRVERETTVIDTGGRGGGGGAIAAIVLLLVVVVLAFLFFGGYLNRAADEVGVNVNIETPDVQAPDIDVNLPPAPAEEPAEPANGN